MGSIPAPPGAGPACAGQEALAVGANQINVFCLSSLLQLGAATFFRPFDPAGFNSGSCPSPQSSCAIRRGADEAQDPSQA